MPELSLYVRIKTGRIKVHHKSPVEHRFWKRVNKTPGCWLWTGHTNGDGYAQFCYKGNRRSSNASRYAYQLLVGEIPDGMDICHTCDNPACVRPDHLFPGTDLDNNRDKVNKNRQAKGERNAGAVLTESQVLEIRRRYKPGCKVNGLKPLTIEFGISPAAVSRIVRGITWRYLL